MTTFRPDTSFPFLALASRLHIPYAAVLTIAEAIENGSLHVGAESGIPSMAMIRDAVMAEQERRAK